jgi:hypothetical protein
MESKIKKGREGRGRERRDEAQVGSVNENKEEDIKKV